MILGHSDLPLPVKIPRGFFEPPDYPHAGMSAAIFFPPRAHYPQWLAIPIRRALAERAERLSAHA